jgi:TrkA domain protein
MSVSESELPGIGRRYEIVAANRVRLVLVVHHSGRRDLFVLRRGEDEPTCAVELSDDQARRIGAILGGAYLLRTSGCEFSSARRCTSLPTSAPQLVGPSITFD